MGSCAVSADVPDWPGSSLNTDANIMILFVFGMLFPFAVLGLRPDTTFCTLLLQVWDYIFLEGPEPQHSKIPGRVLQAMRREFNFWYPFDLRVRSL